MKTKNIIMAALIVMALVSLVAFVIVKNGTVLLPAIIALTVFEMNNNEKELKTEQ